MGGRVTWKGMVFGIEGRTALPYGTSLDQLDRSDVNTRTR